MDKSSRELLKAYLAKADSKLDSATDLLKQHHYDDAVSRCYYVVFHAAQAVLLTEGLQANTHRGILTLFGLHLVKTGKIESLYGRLLSNLKDDREVGDYEAVSFVDQETAENALQEATAFLKRMKDYLAPFLSD